VIVIKVVGALIVKKIRPLSGFHALGKNLLLFVVLLPNSGYFLAFDINVIY